MAEPVHNAPGDDVLAAYIDGELDAEAHKAVDAALAADPATRTRLDALKAGNRPYKDAFQLVLDAAPTERLAANLARIAPRRADSPPPRRVWLSAAAVLLFASGVAIGTVTNRAIPPAPGPTIVAQNQANAPPPAVRTLEQAPAAPAARASASSPTVAAPELRANQAASTLADASQKQAPDALPATRPAPAPSVPSPAAPNAGSAGLAAPSMPTAGTWRQVVADYAMLTTADTLGAMPENPHLADAVSAYGRRLQLDLTADKLMLPMTALKDVRLYDYRGRPLVEASYLSADRATAVALCILFNGAADAPLAFEQRNGQNIVFWTSGGRGFMLVSRAPRDVLEGMARDVAQRLL
jgi:anti-sigma factor RsiW